MRTFTVYQYQTAGGHYEAIKKGWSWPGFFFNWIWAFVKGLTKLGVLLLLLSIFLAAAGTTNDLVNIATSLIGIGIAVWVGSTGNQQREKKLLDEGYMRVGMIEASSEEAAVAEFESSVQAAKTANGNPVADAL